jgi:hypothetical protein
MVAPLGQCGTLNSSTVVDLDEITTVGAAYVLSPFIGAGGSIGSASDSASLQAIANAFAFVNDMVNISTGTALTITPAGDNVPQTKIDTLADVLVPCVNSTGPTSSDCSTLFTDATPIGGSAPTTVFGAMVDIALNPSHNANALFNISTANAAYQPTLNSAPGLWNVNIAGSTTTACGFSGGGDTVTGAVSYSGMKTGKIYLALINTSGCAIGTQGTSISAAGTYTIHGVPPGTYNLEAFMDTLGYGALNAADPSGSVNSININATNYSVSTLILSDPAQVTLTAPTLTGVAGFNAGAVAQFKPITSSGTELPTSYTLQWSYSPAFTSVAGSQTFPAVGENVNVWFVNETTHPELSNGSVFYFRAYGTAPGTPVGPYSTTTSAVTIGAPSAGSAVSGAVTFTGTATGPLYAGFYNQDDSSTSPYLEAIPSPVSMQAYSVDVPNNPYAVYIPVGVIDQNNDGLIDPGDITNVNFQGGPITVNGTLSNQGLTLPSGNVLANVVTQHYLSGSSQTYALYFNLNWAAKLPVSVTLLPSYNADGANVPAPMDIASCAVSSTNCNDGQGGYQIYFNLGTTAPTVGDTYNFDITYSDGSTGTIVATVTNVVATFATNLNTTGSNRTTPTFSWADPSCSGCSNYTYEFYMSGPSGTIWSVPGNSNGLAPGTTSLTWPTDPTDPSNTPSVGSLTTGTTYYWSVTAQDNNYNSSTTTVTYEP